MRVITMFIFLTLFSSCYLTRAYRFRKLNLLDHTKLDYTKLTPSDNPMQYAYRLNSDTAITNWLNQNLANTKTAAFLVIKSDTVVYEKYFAPFTSTTLLPSFSVAKSFVSTLIGIALEEGKIKSLQQPVTDYIPELLKNDQRFANITLQHLLDMRSGIQWNENDYGLKDDAIKLGFRPNMMKHIRKIKIQTTPDKDSEYKSINTMLLGIVIKRATGISLTAYLQQKLWQPKGMQNNATWNTDKKGLEITYGGLNATAIDFAKLGSLFLHQGKINNRQIISSQWVTNSINKDTMFAYNGYRNQWWGVNANTYTQSKSEAEELALKYKAAKVSIYKKDTTRNTYRVSWQTPHYFAEGILGQFVYVDPIKNIVVVRLGQNWYHPKYYITGLIQEAIKMY
jgi:CubicO group peptidase (beta-lactamase class C family)